jgi:hypothetical protein
MKRYKFIVTQPNSKLILSLLLVLFAFSFNLGKMGIDFGVHWDQQKIITSVVRTYEDAVILPGWYNYPSLSYNLVFLASLPDSIVVLLREEDDVSSRLISFRHDIEDALSVFEKVRETLPFNNFPLRARLVFLFFTLLTGVWVYLLARQLGNGRWASLFASTLFFSSWEMAYHARWIAPDGLLMQFGTLTLLLAMLAVSSRGYKPLVWLILSAIAAGLTFGTKYYGGMFIFPVLTAAYVFLRKREQTFREMILLSIGLIGIFTAAFLLSTPGAIVDPLRFIKDINYEMYHYSTGHRGYTVEAGLEHFLLYLSYLVLVAFSPYPPLAMIVFLLGLIGIYALIKQQASKWVVLIFLFIPILYVVYMSQQKVLIVRNYLIVLPFLSVLAGQGLAFLWNLRQLALPIFKGLLFILVLGLLTANFYWQYTAAKSIQERDQADLPARLFETIQTSPNETFYLSPQAQELAASFSFTNVVNEPQQAQLLIYFSRENDRPVSNRFGMYQTPFGPYEVNFNYYPSWHGDTRLVVMKMQDVLAQPTLRDLMQIQP